MGKKASVADVLAEGKERLEASKEPSSSSKRPVRDVAMNAKLPGGLTLKGFMAKHGVDYEEAAAIYKAYTRDVAADDLKIAKYGLPSPPVPTPARGKTPASAVQKGSKADLDEQQMVEAEASTKSKKRSKEPAEESIPSGASKKTKRKDKQPLDTEALDEPEEAVAAKAKPVKRVLFVDEVAHVDDEALPAPKTRVSRKRAPHGSGKADEGGTMAIADASPPTTYRRLNANPDITAPSTPGPSILKRNMYLNFVSKNGFLEVTSTNQHYFLTSNAMSI